MAETMKLEEFANAASEILFGYREASEKEMLNRMSELVRMKRDLKLYEKRKQIADAMRSVCGLIEDAEIE